MCGKKPRTLTTRVSDQCARGASKREGSVIVEAVRTDHGGDADGGKRGNPLLGRKQGVNAEAVVEIDQVACGLLGVVVVGRAAAIFAVMMMHDQFDMLAEVLDERRGALLAIRDVREVTFRGSDGLPW